MTTRRTAGLSVLHFSVVRMRNSSSRFVTCVCACVSAYNGVDGRDRPSCWRSGVRQSVGGSGVEGDARSVKPSSPPTIPTHPHHDEQTPLPHSSTAEHRSTWTRHAIVVNVPIHLPKGPFLVVSASACVRVYARCTRRRTVTGMTRLLLYYCYYNIIIVYYTQ